MSLGTLYMLAGPIGNYLDITLRMIRTIDTLDIVYCEDTRITGLLLKYIKTKGWETDLLIPDNQATEYEKVKVISCNAHNEKHRINEIAGYLDQGLNIGYISDAGTSGLSDPGGLLVAELSKLNHKIVPVPGVSALTALISICGFNLADGFFFAGFLPRKRSHIVKLLEQYKIIFAYESPYRIKKSLEIIAEHSPQAEIVIGRELTKRYEQIIRGNVSEILEQSFPEKGEFTLSIKV